jgi:caffeoyl-CoA O-methyltransferase
MPDIVSAEIETYAEAHTSPPSDALIELAKQTAADRGAWAGMMVGSLEGRFLEMLVFALRPQLVIEIGTFTGYSSISMASTLPPGGRIITCDVDETAQADARRHATKAGVVDRIDYRLGPALETLAGLDGPFDMVFIDADKTNYLNYYEAVLPKLSPAGLIAADNTLWSGRVVDPSDTSADTVAIRAFNDHVHKDPRVICVQLTIRDGVTLIRQAG